MVVVVGTPDVDRARSGSFVSLMNEFAQRLTGQADPRHAPVAHLEPSDLDRADVIVLVARVDEYGLDPTARQALDSWTLSKALTGKVAFCVLIGDRASHFGRCYDVVADALQACGATVFAPACTVVEDQPDSSATVAVFCRYWAPMLPALQCLAAVNSTNVFAA